MDIKTSELCRQWGKWKIWARECCCSGSVVDLYFGSTQFESWLCYFVS
jgi:hypothetical protein